jgi:GntR family transcriptional regulator
MVEITKERGARPKYLQLSDWLKGMIEKGRYAIGERLPSEIELSQMFSMNRNTVRQAILQLVNEGLVIKKNGVGTFVTSRVDNKVQYSLKNITSLTREFSKLGIQTETLIVSKKVIRTTDDLAEKLMLGNDTRAIQIKRVRYGNRMPSNVPFRRSEQFSCRTRMRSCSRLNRDFQPPSRNRLFTITT